MKKTIAILLILILVLAFATVGASAVSLEQVQLLMPEIDVYLYEDGNDLEGLTKENITATLGGEDLSITALEPSEQGIYYVYMLDISGSMPQGHFQGAKDAILKSYGRLRPQDKMALITFGNEVKLVLKGGESQEKVKETLDGLSAHDGNTRFFNAMRALVELVSKTDNMRRIAVVISDGIDETDAGITQEELEETLVKTGISVNALCIDTSTFAESFRSLVNITGGDLYSYNGANAEEVMDGLLDRLATGWLLRLEASSNLATGRETPLVIDAAGSKIELTVVPERFNVDTTFPKVIDAEYQESDFSISVVFSEPMADLDNVDAYEITNETGERIQVDRLDVRSDEECVLYLKGTAPEYGQIELRISGLHDISMESNEMYAYTNVLWLKSEIPVEGPIIIDVPKQGPIIESKTIYLLGGIGALVIAAVIVVILLANKKKKKDDESFVSKKKKNKSTQGTTFVFSADAVESVEESTSKSKE